MKEKFGLVLEGGGAKGAYHIGAYKALHEMGYRFSGIAGTSIGALNGAILTQGDWKKAYDFWYNITNHRAYGINEEAFRTFSRENARYAVSVFAGAVKARGFEVDSLKRLFTEMFDEDKVRTSRVELGIVTVKLPEFKSFEIFKEDIPLGEMFPYLIASANFPLYQTHNTLEERYLDGGFKNNLPINMLPKKGIHKLIAIRTFAPGVTKDFKIPGVEVTYIEPTKNLGSMLDYNNKRARENLKLGYYDAYRAIKGYIGREFCIIPMKDDLTYIEGLLTTADDKIIRLAKIMGHENMNPTRFMFERLLPQIAGYIGLGPEKSYEEILLRFFEEIAITLDLDREKIYKADKFIKIVHDAFFSQNKSINRYKMLPGFIQSNSVLSSFVKSDFFDFIMEIFLG